MASSIVKKKKATHRGRNEGSVYQRKDGKWMGQVQIGFKPDGSRKFITKSGKTKQEITNWLAETRNDILKNTFIEPSTLTLEEWLWNWMTTYKMKQVSASTYTRYLYFMNIHIVPHIGKMKLSDLRTIHLQRLYNQLQDNGMSYSSLKHLHAIFNQSLDVAVRDNLISKNYATYTVRNKPRRSPEVPVLTKEEQHILINNLPFNPIGVLIRTALGTGARLGELLGLSWKDIDFENNIIHIRNGVIRENLFTADGKKVDTYQIVLGPLKTHKSKSDIPINDITASLLRKYKLQQRSFLRNKNLVPTLVFPNDYNELWEPRDARAQYGRVLRDIGLPYIKFHALRHTFATRIMEANVHPKVAQELLGHSTVTITMDTYSHVMPEQKKEAMERIKGIV